MVTASSWLYAHSRAHDAIWFCSAGEKQPVEILADRARWAEQGGDQLKINKQKISISVGIYSILQKGKEFMIHVFEDILNVSDV